MAVSQRKPPKTWSLLGDVRRRPNPYEVTAAKFNYHFRRQPAPFELDPNADLNRHYLANREGSPFNVEDWEGFRDPARLTYSDYVSLQKDRETYQDGLIDHHEAAGSMAELSEDWVATLRALFIPLRFPIHVLQMTAHYAAQMAPSAFIINCANFQAADEMRRIQRMAYATRALANAHGDELAATDTARSAWVDGAEWQGLREALENLLAVMDWGEAFVALNLVLKPAIDALVNQELAQLAADNGDEYLSLALADFDLDAQRSQDWTAALMTYAIEQDPAMADVARGWVDAWTPRAEAAVAGLVALFEAAPKATDAARVVEAVAARRRAFLDRCGL